MLPYNLTYYTYKNMNYNYCAVDCETSGLDKKKHQVLELAVVLDDLSQEVSKENLDEYISNLPVFHCYIKHKTIVGDPYAIAMHNRIFNIISKEELSTIKYSLDPIEQQEYYKKYMVLDLEDIHKELFYFFKVHGLLNNTTKIVAAGKNLASFDIPFLENTVPGFDPDKGGNLFKFHHRIIDIGNYYLDKTDKVPPDLQTCLKRAGLEGTVTHRAVDDAIDCIRALKMSKLYK